MADKEKASTKPTAYHVLRRSDAGAGPRLEVVGNAETHGGEAAILAVAKEPGQYVAIPHSNWTERTVGKEAPPPPKLAIVREPVQTHFENATLGDAEDAIQKLAETVDPGEDKPTPLRLRERGEGAA